jgi:hypothetical protein
MLLEESAASQSKAAEIMVRNLHYTLLPSYLDCPFHRHDLFLKRARCSAQHSPYAPLQQQQLAGANETVAALEKKLKQANKVHTYLHGDPGHF